MKKLFVLTTIVAGSLLAGSANAQVYVNARIGFGIPARRVYVAPPPVVYQPAPVYQDGDAGYVPDPATVVYENDFPGYAYYTYPAWNGHYRDRLYYAHYRPYFERTHSAYFHGRAFDHARYDREHDGHRGNYHRDYHRR